MIRVNLLKNRVQDPGLATAAANEGGNETREALIKIAFILLFTIGLMMFENSNIRALNEERTRLEASTADLEGQATVKAKEVDGIKDIAKQAQELEDKL